MTEPQHPHPPPPDQDGGFTVPAIPRQSPPPMVPAPAPYPFTAPPPPGFFLAPGYPVAPPPVVKTSRKSTVFIFLILLVLAGMVGWQTVQIGELSDRLATAQRQDASGQVEASAAADALASRIASLEKAAFVPDQIAAAALPSVFRVRAGAFSGTAWAVGKPTASGGTHLFTNFHVVESVWESGGRDVGIEHRDLRFEAKIIRVDDELDVAQLETAAKFTGLAVSRETVRPGEPVVVVGAPLGLESSVTTGVVSAFRKLEGTDETYVQFDAAINPGNSGGPVINARGEVVGIATAKIRDAEGIGLAIPVGLACDEFPICG